MNRIDPCETQNYLSNSFNNSINIISSIEQENKEKEELINTFCSKTVSENADNVLYLPLNEMHKQSIEHSLQSLSIDDLKKLSDATQLFFNYLQPTNERRHDVIHLFLVLPSSEWVHIQQLAAHYLSFNSCIESLIKGLSVLVELNSRTAREQLIQLASQSVKFDTPPLERARIV